MVAVSAGAARASSAAGVLAGAARGDDRARRRPAAAGRSCSSDDELSAHGLILGASGAGKTTTLLAILADQIGRGRPVVAIDMKGSPAFARALADAAAAAGRPIKVWTLDGGATGIRSPTATPPSSRTS